MKNSFYTGDALKIPKSIELDGSSKEVIHPYYPSDALVDAVNYARLIDRPLLLRGEPGCGKTKLAQSVAYELFLQKEKESIIDKSENYRSHFFEWHIKSTSKAVDGLYTFDHLGRLRNTQLLNAYDKKSKQFQDLEKMQTSDYVNYGKLGTAFIKSKSNYPSVLLIDEIDKADIDFPNDLLLELDEKRFRVEEIDLEIKAEESPFIIITSNDERELPNAFLRRCVFHYIPFLEKDNLVRILRGRAAQIRKSYNQNNYKVSDDEYSKLLKDNKIDFNKDDSSYLDQLTDRFLEIRQKAEGNPNIGKLPSTSELIDWFRIVHHNILFNDKFDINAEDFKKKIFFKDVLFKKYDDLKIANRLDA